MSEENKKSFPKMPAKNWWAVREKFVKTIPSEVTENYISSVLNMTPDSARSNVITPLKAVGLIDADNKPTELAKRWRDDAQYAKVCEEIRKKVYPNELVEAFPSVPADTDGIERWFMNHGGVGSPAAKMLGTFYVLLTEANPSKAKEAATKHSNVTGSKPKAASKPAKTKSPEELPEQKAKSEVTQQQPASGPSLHIDVQVHIASDAPAEQIDKIFASMAKHLKNFQSGARTNE
ncbi:MAG TPA: hypothetical protein DCQ92_04785 [Verrucomicrobia subdivision 3 bacterium]|nr:hypothetical protein [Limisphaerales bacterium]